MTPTTEAFPKAPMSTHQMSALQPRHRHLVRRLGVLSAVTVGLLAVSGCSNMTETQQRVLSGGAIGTAGGAVLGAATGGSAIAGGIIGGVVGAGGSYIYDQMEKGR